MRKLNFSKKRDAMLEVICSTNTHPTAEWIYNRLKSDYPNLSLGTVYRNLNLFKEQGLVVSVANVNGQERFDGNTSAHAHFVCTKCGRIIDVDCVGGSKSFDNRIASMYDCEVDRHTITFYGTCSSCRHAHRDSTADVPGLK